MTDSIPLDQLGSDAGDDGKRRDRWGRLLVVPPGLSKPEGYTRVTTVAKTTDEGGGLLPWKATAAVVGTLRHRGIRAKWEALIAEHGEPWYAGEESKAQCKRLAEESSEAGGGGDRREQGNALHAITAILDRGDKPKHLSAETASDLVAYRSTLTSYGISVISGMIETTIVLDSYRVGGTFDRLVTVEGRELPMVADLKTGEDLSYSGGAFSIQLAAYARGEAIYEQGDEPKLDRRVEMPEVDQHEGLVIHLPAGSGRCDLYVVDLDVGWEGFELAMAVRGWRPRGKKALAPFSSWRPPPKLVVVPEPDDPDLSPAEAEAAVETALADYVVDESLLAVRDWLQGRIDVLGANTATRVNLGQLWPMLDVPTLKSSTAHTREQLDAICRLLDDIEARHSVPFGATRPSETDEERISRFFPNPTRSNT